MIRHFVAVRIRDETTAADRDALMRDLDGLRARIPGTHDFQARRNISVEDTLVRGFRDVFWFDFADTAARDAYLADPVHRAIGARLVASAEAGTDGIFVIDYEP